MAFSEFFHGTLQRVISSIMGGASYLRFSQKNYTILSEYFFCFIRNISHLRNGKMIVYFLFGAPLLNWRSEIQRHQSQIIWGTKSSIKFAVNNVLFVNFDIREIYRDLKAAQTLPKVMLNVGYSAISIVFKVRHGAASGLREIIKTHGSGAGKRKYMNQEEVRH